jgi:hypothetical protein
VRIVPWGAQTRSASAILPICSEIVFVHPTRPGSARQRARAASGFELQDQQAGHDEEDDDRERGDDRERERQVRSEAVLQIDVGGCSAGDEHVAGKPPEVVDELLALAAVGAAAEITSTASTPGSGSPTVSLRPVRRPS